MAHCHYIVIRQSVALAESIVSVLFIRNSFLALEGILVLLAHFYLAGGGGVDVVKRGWSTSHYPLIFYPWFGAYRIPRNPLKDICDMRPAEMCDGAADLC